MAPPSRRRERDQVQVTGRVTHPSDATALRERGAMAIPPARRGVVRRAIGPLYAPYHFSTGRIQYERGSRP